MGAAMKAGMQAGVWNFEDEVGLVAVGAAAGAAIEAAGCATGSVTGAAGSATGTAAGVPGQFPIQCCSQ